MSWNYRVMKQEWRGSFYSIHEVYYGEGGKPEKHSAPATGCMGDTLADLRADLEMRLQALSKPVLEYSEDHGYRELPETGGGE